jgi:hypothetical protein
VHHGCVPSWFRGLLEGSPHRNAVYLRAQVPSPPVDHFVFSNIMFVGFRAICVRTSCTTKVIGFSLRARKLHPSAWGISRHCDAIPPPKYITGGTSQNRIFHGREMSSNHPDKSAEGGKFTGKVTLWSAHSDGRILGSKSKRFPEGSQLLGGVRLPRSEQKMQPKSESTRLEGPNGLE